MLSKNQSISGGPGSGSLGVKKKKAPPRPPPPSSNTIRTSQSFRTGGELKLQSQKISSFSQRSAFSVDNPGQRPSDLIDFSTPPGSPETARKTIRNFSKDPAMGDYLYRVGASVFYIKSQLKNSAKPSQTANPFSPPRPSAQALLASPAKHPSNTHNQSSLYGNVPHYSSTSTSTSTSMSTTTAATASTHTNTNKVNPTIIKRLNENNNSIKSQYNQGGSVRSSSGSSDWSDYSQQSNNQSLSQQQQQPRYGNLPLATWDEPPAQNPTPPKTVTSAVVLPTIIKPPTSGKPSLLPKPKPGANPNRRSGDASAFAQPIQLPPFTGGSGSGSGAGAGEEPQQRNYYDDPPDSDFDDDEFNEDSFASPPMPNEPPPPPPVDVALNDWVDSTTEQDYSAANYGNQGSENDRAYAIALYDYLPDTSGDLPLQAGDLVYLMKKIDDAWLYGHCAGVEGMFPSNYVNVVVPLPEEQEDNSDNMTHENLSQDGFGEYESQQHQPINTKVEDNPIHFATALYQFDAETDSDLSLRSGDMVKIYGRLNEDWLYGDVAGKVGQFPAAFVEPVPSDLPIIPS